MEDENKAGIIALLSCNKCAMHEPKCDVCGNDFSRRNQIIYCYDIEHYGDNKHYCSRCNKKRQSKGSFSEVKNNGK